MAGGSTQWRGRSVISKVASMLDVFTPATPQLSLGELAARTGLPMSTTYRLAVELVAWGALERADGGAGYRLGSRLWELGTLAPRREHVGAVALPFMQDLHEATRAGVHLAVLDGPHAIYAETVTEGRASPSAWRATRLPLHATSAGKVLLAHAPASLQFEVLDGELRRYTPHTLTTPSALRRALGEVRRSGVAYDREERALGERSVASPVFGPGGGVVGALALVKPESVQGTLLRLGPAVRTAAISISRELQERGTTNGQVAGLADAGARRS